MPGFQSFFVGFLLYSILAKLATSSIRVKIWLSKNLCFLVLWTKVDSPLEGLIVKVSLNSIPKVTIRKRYGEPNGH